MALIQVRNVPDEIHRTVKARAAMKGVSLSEYVLRMIAESAELPTAEELDERIRRRGPSGITTEQILAARDSGRKY